MIESGFVDDLVAPGMLHAVLVRSTYAHSRLDGISKDPDFDWSDVVLVKAKDIPGVNYVAPFPPDQPVLAEGICRHVGEPVLAIAAESHERALAARRSVTPREAPLVAVTSLHEALVQREEGSAAVHCRRVLEKGDGIGCVERALARNPSAMLVEGRYRTGAQEHLYLEPQGVLARPWGAGGVEVRGSLQCPFYVAESLAGVLGLPIEQVRVIQCPTGGGFGGKEDYPSLLACHAALLALKAHRPVKLILERSEDMAVTTRRHPSEIHSRTAVLPDGCLLASEIEIFLDGGAYSTVSQGVLVRAMLHALGPYRCPHAGVQGAVLLTNTPPNGAFRGFGAPQACFAAERQMDRIAAHLNLSPVELRRRNLLRAGETTLTGQRLVEPVAVSEVLDQALIASDWEKRRIDIRKGNCAGGSPPDRHVPGAGASPRLRGVGVSLFAHGAGFAGNREAEAPAEVTLELETTGHVRIRSAAVDMGQGARITLARIASEALDIDPDFVELVHPDTATCPDSGPTIASRTCMVVGELVRQAGRRLKRRVGAPLAGEPGAWSRAAARYLAAGGRPLVRETYGSPAADWDPALLQGDAYACFGWGCDVVEVEVDPDTLEVSVTGLWSAHDVGRSIAPKVVTGQVEGGCVQGLGFALMERLILEDGRLVNASLADYPIPTAMDAPDLETHLVEAPFSGGPSGAKGMGEMPIDGPGPALAAAIEHATGVSPVELPVTPESLFRLLERKASA